MTPDRCVAMARERMQIDLHSLMGGLDPDLASEGLELVASHLPRQLAPGPA